MREQFVVVANEVGLHAYPASAFIQAANAFKCQIFIEKDEKRGNAKSLLSVLSLSIVRDDAIKIITDGPDEERALDTLVKFIDSQFEDRDKINKWLSELITR